MTIDDAIKTNIKYLKISNLIFIFLFAKKLFTKLTPATNTTNIETIYIILCINIELQMKIMAVLVFCVAKIAEIVYPIENAFLAIIQYTNGIPITVEAKKTINTKSLKFLFKELLNTSFLLS